MLVIIPSRLRNLLLWLSVLCCTAVAMPASAQQNGAASDAGAGKRARAVGTIKSIDGNTLTLTTDTGTQMKVILQLTTRLLRMEPGQTDLKSAPSIAVGDLQVGDRLLAGGTASDDGRTVTATTAVVMKKSDVAEKQQREREEWRKNGVSGTVKSVDAAAGTVVISTGALSTNTTTIHIAKDTLFRRYPADSWNYDDAKPGTFDQIKAGDQLNARGTKSADGKELSAAEVVSGTFRSIPAAVLATDASNSTITVTDLANKRPVTLKIGPQSQMHQLPAMFAQRIAMRLKAGAAGTSAQAPPGAGDGARAGDGAAAKSEGGEGRPAGGFGGGQRAGGAPDFQQMLNRMPAVSLSGLTKGDAVMIVATEGTPQSPSTVIVLLSGVEPILTAASPSQASTILSPWNLSTGGIAGTGDTP